MTHFYNCWNRRNLLFFKRLFHVVSKTEPHVWINKKNNDVYFLGKTCKANHKEGNNWGKNVYFKKADTNSYFVLLLKREPLLRFNDACDGTRWNISYTKIEEHEIFLVVLKKLCMSPWMIEPYFYVIKVSSNFI